MIELYLLTELLSKYDIDANKVVKNNENILTYGEYVDIDNTLDYLKNELKISSRNIEKCPSILCRNVSAIKSNIQFLNDMVIKFKDIDGCLHVLSTEPSDLKDTYDYVFKEYGKDAILEVTAILAINVDRIQNIEKLNIPFKDKKANLSIAIGKNSLKEIGKIAQSKEFKTYPHLFTSQTLAHATLKNIQDIIASKEFQEHSDLFTSQTLAHATLKNIQDIIGSKEFQEHSDLFTSTTLAHATLNDIQNIIRSEEFEKYPHLFTSQTLAYATLEDIQDIIASKEFQDHSDLFTSTTLAHSTLNDIQNIIRSEEFEKYPHLFTSQVLAYSKLKDIRVLLNLSYWNDERYAKLLTSSILSKAKKMCEKLPKLFEIAEYYDIDKFLNTNYLTKSPSQNFAIINYLNDNSISLVNDGKLNSIFSYQPCVLKKKYNIDLNELIKKYPYNEEMFSHNMSGGTVK